MSESYTEGGDSLQAIGWNYYAGQTFTPVQTHILNFIDINLRTVHPTRAPSIWVYLADSFHKPTGPILSQRLRSSSEKWNRYNVFRMRTEMSSYLLLAGTEYIIVIHAFALDTPNHMSWQYDKGDATYPRGIRIISTDGGSTWATRPNDDHIFAEFGTPPAPPPKPEPPPPPPPTEETPPDAQPPAPPSPPIFNWAAMSLEQILTATGYIIIVATNVPCHLYMYWTNIPPEKHMKPIIRRGVAWKTAIRYCFVQWHENEQQEPGDTLYHTFIKEPWPVCETRWFVFRAKVDGIWTKSLSPIFKKHREEKKYQLIILEPWTWYIIPEPSWQHLLTEPWSS